MSPITHSPNHNTAAYPMGNAGIGKQTAWLVLTGFLLMVMLPALSHAKPPENDKFRVLVVMSYEEANPWCEEIKAGIETTLGDSSDIRYVYMDTKVNYAGGLAKADEAWALFQAFQPQGVIAVDDNAQWMFVTRFLKDRTNVPVMFSGVNSEPEKYGYPNNHISGILERAHVRESMAFFRQLQPSADQFCVLVHHSPSGNALARQVEAEQSTYPARLHKFYAVRSTDDMKRIQPELMENCDALYVDSLAGLTDSQSGQDLKNAGALDAIVEHFPGPIIGANHYHVALGALCAVVKTGEEQGATAARMLKQAMQGTPVSDIPVTRNYKGRRVINVKTLKRLNITPRPIVLRGAKLLRETR